MSKEWPQGLVKVQITLLGETRTFGADQPDHVAIQEAIDWLLEKQQEHETEAA